CGGMASKPRGEFLRLGGEDRRTVARWADPEAGDLGRGERLRCEEETLAAVDNPAVRGVDVAPMARDGTRRSHPNDLAIDVVGGVERAVVHPGEAVGLIDTRDEDMLGAGVGVYVEDAGHPVPRHA